MSLTPFELRVCEFMRHVRRDSFGGEGMSVVLKRDVNTVEYLAAVQLTSSIRAAAERCWSLLREAHARRVWKTLGYSTFRDYCAGEFHMGRSQAYRLLDYGQVVEGLELAAGSPIGDVSELAAREIKPQLEIVKADVAARVAGGEPPAEAVAAAVKTARDRVAPIVFGDRVPPAKVAEIVRRLRAGERAWDIACACQTAPQTIRKIRLAHGIAARGGLDRSPRARAARVEQIRAMAERGHSSAQIAAAVGMSEDGCRVVARKEQIAIVADRALLGRRRPASNTVMDNIAVNVAHLTTDLGLIDVGELDRARIAEWSTSLRESVRTLAEFIRRLAKEQK